MDADLLKLLGPYGFGGVIVWMAWRVLSAFAARAIAAMDRIAAKVDEHTAKDLAAHNEVRAAIVRVEGKVDAALDWHERTPVESERAAGIRAGALFRRPPTGKVVK